MNIKLPLNDLMCLIQKAESSGNVKEAISLIDTHISELEPYEQNIITNVKEYLQKKLPQTATEISARVQVEMSAQLNNLKKLFSRMQKNTILPEISQKPVDRANWSMLRENLNNNIAALIEPIGREFWLRNLFDSSLDGLTGKMADLRFMEGAQRLVDLGIIDDSTLVIIHTGHNIPIASKLAENTKQLGQVNGILEFSRNSFPSLKERTKNAIEMLAMGKDSYTGLPKEKIAALKKQILPFKEKILYDSTYEEKLLEGYIKEIMENEGRINNQNFTFPGVLSQKVEGKGAKFLGIDFHRTAPIDIATLPTAQELKKAGIKKVVFLDETPPISSFDTQAAKELFEPMTQEKANIITFYFDKFTENIRKGNIKLGLIAFNELEKLTTLADIEKKISKPSEIQIAQAKDKVKNGLFGYTTKHVSRGDIASYLEKLQNDIPLIIEGVDINKLEVVPLEHIAPIMDRVVYLERSSFEEKAALTKIIQEIDKLLENRT